MQNNGGFTLIEILLVIFIIGLLGVSITLPTGVLARTELLSARDRIVMDLRWARMKAVVDNCTYYLRVYTRDFDNDDKCDYQIYRKGSKSEKIVVRGGSYPADYKLYKNTNPVVVNADYYDRIRFTARGTALNGTIGLKDKGDKLIMITISQLGRIRSYER